MPDTNMLLLLIPRAAMQGNGDGTIETHNGCHLFTASWIVQVVYAPQ